MADDYIPPNDWSETEINLEEYNPPSDWSETEIVLGPGSDTKSNAIAIGNGFVPIVKSVLEQSGTVESRSTSDGSVAHSSNTKSNAVQSTETVNGSVANSRSIIDRKSTAIGSQSSDRGSVTSSSEIADGVKGSTPATVSVVASYESISELPDGTANAVSPVISPTRSSEDSKGIHAPLPESVQDSDFQKQSQTKTLSATAPVISKDASVLDVKVGIEHSQHQSAPVKVNILFTSTSQTTFSVPIIWENEVTKYVSVGISVNDSKEFETNWDQIQIEKIVASII